MKLKILLRWILLIFVFFSLGFLIYTDFLKPKKEKQLQIALEKQKEDTLKNPIPVVDTQKKVKIISKDTVKQIPQKIKKPIFKIIAYYFYATPRCYSCVLIENYIRECLTKYFEKELKAGILEFKPVDVSILENRHYIFDYQLQAISLIISLVKDGKEEKWKNLTGIWFLARDKERFNEYIKEEIESFLKELK